MTNKEISGNQVENSWKKIQIHENISGHVRESKTYKKWSVCGGDQHGKISIENAL